MTLVEVVVSSAAAAILLGGIASTIVLATQALPSNVNHLDEAIDAADVLTQLSEDLLCATEVTSRTRTSIGMLVPDRSGDGMPEKVIYQWSGTAGDALTRTYSGGRTVDVIDEVDHFELEYEVVTVETDGDPVKNESGETWLAGWGEWSSLAFGAIQNTQWWGDVFTADLPGNAVGWRVTRIALILMPHGKADDEGRFELRTVNDSGYPTDTVIADVDLIEAALPGSFSTTWIEFPSAPAVDPDQPLAFILRHTDGDTCGQVLYQSGGVWDSRVALVKTDNKGESWSYHSDESLLFEVYGTVITEGEPEIVQTSHLVAVRVHLRIDSDGGAEFETRAPLLNQPETGG